MTGKVHTLKNWIIGLIVVGSMVNTIIDLIKWIF